MIAKYAGACEYCGGAIAAGDDCYYNLTTKKLSHHGCTPKTNGPERRETATQLAGRLGFLPHAEAMATDWPLFLLSAAGRGAAAGRPEPAAHPEQDSLFGMSKTEEDWHA